MLSNLPETRGKHKILFCGDFLPNIFQKLSRQVKYFSVEKKEKGLGAALSHGFDQLSQLNGNKLYRGL